MNKILLIGSTGKIGKYVLNELLKHQSFDVRILVRRKNEYKNSSILSFHGDIMDVESLYPGIKWCDVVINCAGMVSYKPQDRNFLNQLNVIGTKNILEACLLYDKSLIHTSSAVVYGSTKLPIPQVENIIDSSSYLSGYAISKLKADQLITSSSVNSIILRPSTLISSCGSTFAKLLGLYRSGFRAGLQGGASFVSPEDIGVVYGRAVLQLINNQNQKYIYNIGGNNILIKDVFNFFQENEFRKTLFISNNLLKILSYVNDKFLLPVLNRSIITRENFLTGSLFTYLNSEKAQQELGYTITPFAKAAKIILKDANH